MSTRRRGTLIVGAAILSAAIGIVVSRRPAAHPPPGPSSAAIAPSASAPPPASHDRPVFSGCSAVLRDGTCEHAARDALRVWVPDDAAHVRFLVDGTAVAPAKGLRIAGGTRYEIALGSEHRALEIRVGERSALTLRLAPATASSPGLERAQALRAEGKLDDAASLARAERGSATDDVGRARAVGLLARIALARGDEAQVDALFAESIRLGEQAGRPSSAADDAFALVFSLIGRFRLAEAHHVLTRARELSRGYPDGQARVAYYQAWIALTTERWRDALRGSRDAGALAARLGLRSLGRNAHQLAALALQALGRAAEAVEDLVALFESDAPEMNACDAADLAANVGTAALEDERRTVDAREWLERARNMYRDKCVGSYDPTRLANVLGELASAELEVGNVVAARARLADAERELPHPREELALEWLRTRGAIGLAAGDARAALAAFDALAARARGVGAAGNERQALEGRAEALARRGDREGAVAALLRAAERLDEESAGVPLGEGRESFVRARERADARRVELLVELARPGEALAHLLRARARVLASLSRAGRLEALSIDARARWDEAVGAYRRERDALERDAAEDWKLATSTLAVRLEDRTRRAAAARSALEQALADALAEDSVRRGGTRADAPPLALRPPRVEVAPGELVLAYQESEHGWIGIAADAQGVRARALGAVDSGASGEALSGALLAPFAPELARARRLAVLTFGAHHVDVHALPWEGAPLVARMAVVYPLARATPPRDEWPASGGVALVVGDPTLDLGGAQSEVRAVGDALAGAGAGRWRTTVLVGAAAGGAAVRASLASADLFHYAGHASFAGRDGWESALRLADHAQLGVPDILSLGRVPRVVVLLGCETARTSGVTAAEGLGLAHAFVAAGARAVIAASREVDDAGTARLARLLYAPLARGDDPAEALREAQRSLAAAGARDWEAFRVLVP